MILVDLFILERVSGMQATFVTILIRMMNILLLRQTDCKTTVRFRLVVFHDNRDSHFWFGNLSVSAKTALVLMSIICP